MQATALLDAAERAAQVGADIVQSRAAGVAGITWEAKGPADFVSDVDRASEEAIRRVIHAAVPHARVLGEEFSPLLAGGRTLEQLRGTVFVVDPLDGTTNFLHGFPTYAVSIGVLVDGVLTAGVVRHAVTGDTFTAARGGGAFRNGQPIRVSQVTDPSRALIGTGFPFADYERLPLYLPQFAAIAGHTAGIRRPGAASLDLADVACGRFEGFWELTLAPWDVAAGILLIREAGGLVTDLTGNPAPVGYDPIVAGNPAIHAWLLETIGHAGDTSTFSFRSRP